MGELKEDLKKSLEKSVEFLRSRYPQGHPLLSSIERQLNALNEKQGGRPADSAGKVQKLDGACCEKHTTCRFFLATKDHKDISDILEEYVSVYCCGPARQHCFRLKYVQQHGKMPPENVSPTGDKF